VLRQNVFGLFEVRFTRKSETGMSNLYRILIVYNFRLYVKTISMLTFIKHNLILENPDRCQNAKLIEDETIEETDDESEESNVKV
jgi:hypothetical protein